MRKESWLYVLLGVMFILYVSAEYFSPKPLDWTTTFHENDKNPFGAFILNDRMNDLFNSTEISNLTLYELKDSSSQILILAEFLSLDEADLEVLLSKADQGQSIFIASESFSENFTDTLGIISEYQPLENIGSRDTIAVTGSESTYEFSSLLFKSHFESLDSTWSIHASQADPILISRDWGQGKIVLCSAPLLFSNYGMMQDYRFAEMAMNLIPNEPIHFTKFYQLGKPQNTSPFRYILTEESLRWALYMSLAVILLFLIVNSQRRQRHIPVIAPLENTTVHFIKTMAALFYREKNHKKAGEKLANHFLHELQRKYLIKPSFSESYYSYLSKKTQSEKTEVIKVFEGIQYMQQASSISEQTLSKFYQDFKAINFK